MKIYFLSSIPCFLTLNFERFAEINLADRIYASFSPENAQPLGFFLTESLVDTPPNGCEIYILRDGVAVYAKEFPSNDLTLRPLSQERLDDSLVTIFWQGGLYLSVQTPSDFFVVPLPPSFAQAKCSIREGLLFVEGQNALIIYGKDGTKLFEEEVITYSVENGILNATLPLSDRLGRTAECSYQLLRDACPQISISIRQTHAQDGSNAEDKIADELLAYAFFESVFIGANYTQFLSNELQSSAEKIVGFLGDFKSVTLTDNPKVCGLVYEKKPRLFEVLYYEIETENRQITEVKRV